MSWLRVWEPLSRLQISVLSIWPWTSRLNFASAIRKLGKLKEIRLAITCSWLEHVHKEKVIGKWFADNRAPVMHYLLNSNTGWVRQSVRDNNILLHASIVPSALQSSSCWLSQVPYEFGICLHLVIAPGYKDGNWGSERWSKPSLFVFRAWVLNYLAVSVSPLLSSRACDTPAPPPINSACSVEKCQVVSLIEHLFCLGR